MKTEVACALTGHRPSKLGGYDRLAPMRVELRAKLRSFIREHGVTLGITGMALGFDQDGAEAFAQCGVPFIAAVPFAGQERMWPAESQAYYRRILERAQEVVIVSPGGYSAAAMQRRNEWMVNRAVGGFLVAAWDGSPGGTANCVRYARGRDIRIHNLLG